MLFIVLFYFGISLKKIFNLVAPTPNHLIISCWVHYFLTFVENTTTNTELLIATVSNRDSRKAGLDLKLSAMNYRRK